MIVLFERLWASPTGRAVTFGWWYFAALEFGRALTKPMGPTTSVVLWPSAGVFFAALVLTRRSSWPGMIVAAGVAGLASDVVFHGQSPGVWLGFSVARCGQAVVGAWLLSLLISFPMTFSRISEVVAFVGTAVFVGPVWGATVGAAVASLDGAVPFGTLWRAWWIADALGVLVTAPLILTWAGEGRALFLGKRPGRVVEFAILFVGLTLIDLAVYRDFLPPPWNVPTFILPFLLWAAVRFNPAVSSLAILVIALVGLWSVTEGRGPFAALTPVPGKQVLRAQGTLGVISVSVILLAAVVAERKRGERQKAALIEELERALIEIKTLRDLIPLCSWCKKMRDDQGYWQSLEVYMKDHYDAKITHGICPSCVESQFRDLAISLPTPAARTP